MSMSRALAPHLPYLRRYARALTGSQESGDAYVRASLTALLAGEQALDDDLPPRVALYRLFHRIWSTAGARDSNRRRAWRKSEEAGEPAFGPVGRAARGAAADGGGILQPRRGRRHPRTWRRTKWSTPLSRRSAPSKAIWHRTVLIIEDEPIIALDLENLVTELGHEVVATAATRDQAVELALQKETGPDPGRHQSGRRRLGPRCRQQILDSFDIPVIFVTAYPEKLLTGERPEPTYLIAKPFLPEAVQATVGQALFFHPLNRRVDVYRRAI